MQVSSRRKQGFHGRRRLSAAGLLAGVWCRQGSPVLLVLLWLVPGAAGTARANEPVESSPEPDARFHADVEIDPTAYLLNGHSLHVGLGFESWRLDLGNFALDVPEFAEPNAGFATSGLGYGLKLQWFPFREQAGIVLGVEAALARFSVVRDATRELATQTQFLPGMNAGYRLHVSHGFYVSFWAGLSYALGARDLRFGEAEYDMNPWRLFPAIHLGYSLR
jgi:hypothetical protein